MTANHVKRKNTLLTSLKLFQCLFWVTFCNDIRSSLKVLKSCYKKQAPKILPTILLYHFPVATFNHDFWGRSTVKRNKPLSLVEHGIGSLNFLSTPAIKAAGALPGARRSPQSFWPQNGGGWLSWEAADTSGICSLPIFDKSSNPEKSQVNFLPISRTIGISELREGRWCLNALGRRQGRRRTLVWILIPSAFW